MNPKCPKCQGSGLFKKTEKTVKCNCCNGTGEKVKVNNNTSLEIKSNVYEKDSQLRINNKYGYPKDARINYFFAVKGKLKGFVNVCDIMVNIDFGDNKFENRQFSELL